MATDVLVHTGYCNGNSSAPIKVYVGYTTSQDISTNKSTINCYLWINVPSGWNIGPWSDTRGSYVGKTDLTFSGAINNIGAGNHIISDTKSFTVNHNADGTGSATIYWKWGVNSSWGRVQNPSGSFNITLPTIPRQANITSAPDFNDTGNPTIQYNNQAGNSVSSLQARIENSAGTLAYVDYRDISKTGSSYTFNLTEAERNVLRNATPNSNTLTVKFVVKTVIGSNTFWSTVNKTMTIVNGNPTFTNNQLSYQDTNNSIVAITGNNQHIVRNNSNLKVTYTGATANKGASISRYEISFNGSTQTKYQADTIDYGTVNISADLDVQVKAIDSRGNSTTISKTITILDWVLPSAVIEAQRVNNYEDDTNLKVNVTISSVDSKNAIESIKYRYKKVSDTNYGSYTTINNNQTYQISIDKLYAWNFQFVINDKFGQTTYNITIAKGMPIMFIDIDKLSVGIDCFPSKSNSLEVEGVAINKDYAVGCIIQTDNNTNPGTSMGGTWSSLGTVTVGSSTIYYWKRTA